ncbi:TolB-like translocation protein [Alienimonas californiensis]|uniref:WD40-like Beta Propeller Repeat protein n=1 Tax=Alienimonas californiensis TaxID=2527989 RepID=A0A517P6A4_9PLAN|nr:PD40 domain-containing protein [Alienimonas californiensis]QDT14897.1 WD40-like Beta Propeller Repeat protein [Alienimonas californiensis]
MTRPPRFVFGLLALACLAPAANADDEVLAAWRSGVSIRAVAPQADRHVIHSYFNVCPESPDGRFVLYYTSATAEGETGDVRLLERATGEETVIATDVAVEDAHRAACQQWSAGGAVVVYHVVTDGRWFVKAYDVATGQTRTLAADRQVGFGAPGSEWAPIYGCHWNPGEHRDLELVHVRTGEIRTAATIAAVVEEYGDWVRQRFGTTEVSIFFPVVSPDGGRVFFKIARPSGTDDFRSSRASDRAGLVAYDLREQRFLRRIEQWGHPSWTPDGGAIFEKGNYTVDLETGRTRRYAPSCITNHPTVAPDGRLFVTDADVEKRPFGGPGRWAVAVGSMNEDDFVVLDVFDNTGGARSWRRNHPHPAFSADGRRIYYNVNAGDWTTLRVAERDDG